jgi:transposase
LNDDEACASDCGKMMGQHSGQKELFNYQVNLDRRIRADHPLRAIRSAIDFSFVRQEVADRYGRNGNVSVDPEVILKLMFLLFLDNVKSERELMRMLPERLDYLWFIGFGLDDEIPDHSVLSKARARWGQEVFESLFVRTVQQCVQAGLVDGTKLHLDGSLINANASRDSVVRSSPELIAALKGAYQVQERKLQGHSGAPNYQPVNTTLMSTTDPDAPCVRQNKQGTQGDTRPRYKQHRAVDDRCGVITAVVTTPGDIAEPTQTVPLIEQHEQHTGSTVGTVVGDQQYGTIDNHRELQQRGLRTHLKTLPGRPAPEGRFGPQHFTYDQASDRFQCPAGQWLYPRAYDAKRQHTEYTTRKGVCAACALRSQCTGSKHGRTVGRYREHEQVMRARAQAQSPEAKADYAKRRHLMEGSYAQGANCHGFKRARWRRLPRQQIQDWIIAACQNVKILVRALGNGPIAGENAAAVAPAAHFSPHGLLESMQHALRASCQQVCLCVRTFARTHIPTFQLN